MLGAGLPIVASADQPVASKSGSAVAENGRIIFQVDAGGGSAQDIYTMRNDGSQSPLLAGATDDRDATFSPDGRRIAFRRNGGGADTDIFVANSDGTNPVNLTTDIADAARFPTFSPDGKRIAYEQQVGIQRDIVIMNADGTGRLNLTSANTTQDQFPSFSDGKRIAFERDVLGDEEIVMNVDGSNAINVSQALPAARRCPTSRPTASGSRSSATARAPMTSG